ncbi:MAG: hypothetical protein E3J54_03530 [Actinobacteria bacterium]|nr:MAG: hypothetical protein E3J54_03530 [Actinomycetota bacterium]
MEKGLVINSKDNKVTIRLEATDACKRCAGCEIVGNEAILKDVENKVRAKKGDTVLIDNKPKNIMIGAIIVYLLPLIFLIAGYFIGLLIVRALSLSTDIAILFALLVFALSFPAVRIIDRRLEKNKSFKPIVVKKL